jgi:hypothetical protein
MKTDLVSLYLTAASHDSVRQPVATSGELTLCCAWINQNTQVAVHVNPSITEYGPDIVESTLNSPAQTLVFDIAKPQPRRVALNGSNYEIRLLTWSRHDDDTLRFDFEVEQIEN